MNEAEALAKMVAPGTHRPGKYGSDRGFGGVIQIHVTRACDKSCYACTQGSNLGGKTEFMSPDHFQEACRSLMGYRGVVGMFGGNPAIHPQFERLCEIMKYEVPYEQRGIWSNNPMTSDKARIMQATFNPAVSNINVHLDHKAAELFRVYWPQVRIVGLIQDSRHSPPFVAMKDVIADEGERWELISRCPINQHWSAMIGVFRGELRAWFCEIAGAQSILHQHESDYPDTGINFMGMNKPDYWWRASMMSFGFQVRKHCHDCGVPMQGHGELAQAPDDAGREYVSATHAGVYKLKRPRRALVMVTERAQLGVPLERMTNYLGNASR